jgi:uncharacterized damage-inducible protein DinB
MRKGLLLGAIFTLFLVNGLFADSTQTATTSGFRADFLQALDEIQQKVIQLAEAIPAEKYSWRPAEGVRSVGEVYMHIAGGNYFVLKLAGVEPPAGMSGDENMKENAGDKAKCIEAMKASMDFVRQQIQKTSDADLEKKIKLPWAETTVRGVYLILSNHMSEHLGQSIAYARMNGVVPPWTAAEQAAANK